MDWMEQERERGITITSAATTAFWNPTYMPKEDTSKKCRFNIIDTPGHIDFTIEVKRSLRVLDGAVVVFDGVAGVEPQSETNWRYASDAMVPRICFINKLDRMGANFDKAYLSILDRLSKKAVRMQMPIGEEENYNGIIDLLTMKEMTLTGEMGKEVGTTEIPAELLEEAKKRRAEMIEKIVETDENLMTRYLEGDDFTIDELKVALRKATIANEIFPVFCGSALKNKRRSACA
jgi:elongation factor G